MDNKEFSKQLENRTKKFAISVISLSASLPVSPEGKVLRNQFTKSGTSIGRITERQTVPEVKQISVIKSRFAKVSRMRQLTG
jgi:hypothetical protein